MEPSAELRRRPRPLRSPRRLCRVRPPASPTMGVAAACLCVNLDHGRGESDRYATVRILYGPSDLRVQGFHGVRPFLRSSPVASVLITVWRLSTIYYAVSGPTVALFALGQRRLLTVVYTISWLILLSLTVLPTRPSFVRNVLNALLFLGFIIFTHYLREMADRRMYTMRAELKVQYRAKINERKTMDAKRRFSSYIFHEVRVPLNTALLAVQNLKGLNLCRRGPDRGAASLQDVLDFSRMERGGFSSVSCPFSLHNLMRSIFVPLRLDAAARGLTLETMLDPRIDQVAKLAAYPKEVLASVREGDGLVMGDEMRLRQIIGNLVSNACKFTSSGGKLTITTSLVYPIEDYVTPQHLPTAAELAGIEDVASETTSATYAPRLSTGRLQQHEAHMSPQPKEMLVVRFEIQDTGIGIRPSDMAENRLFSPYVQTDVGRMQGGKGTGLGLSLVRQIVMLSGGRLGVKSKVGEGSTFWVELPFAIGAQTREPSEARSRPTSRPGTASNDAMLEKERDCHPLTATPMSASSAGSDYRFVTSLRKRSSDPTLDSVDEGRTRNSSLSIPQSYRFSPPASPSLAPATPPVCINAPPAPSSITPGGSPLTNSDTLPTSPPTFSHPFGLVPPHRPGAQSNISSQSAPAEVTLPQPPSSPVVTSSPTAAPPTPSPAGSRIASGGSTALEFRDGPLRVLVVDDDTLTRRLMSRMMLRLGCKVETAENGKIALDLLLARAESDDGVATAKLDDVDAAERGVKREKKAGFGLDPRSGVEAHKNFDITFLDNQVRLFLSSRCLRRHQAEGAWQGRSRRRGDCQRTYACFLASSPLFTAHRLLSVPVIADQEQYLEQGASFILTKPYVLSTLATGARLILNCLRTSSVSARATWYATLKSPTSAAPRPRTLSSSANGSARPVRLIRRRRHSQTGTTSGRCCPPSLHSAALFL
ncbi:SPOSA6832_01943, partial [Sporobolomyces salmonicolor]